MKLYYSKFNYVADNSIAIKAFIKDGEYGYLKPYGDVTICLAGYGMTPKVGTVYIPTYKMTKDFIFTVIDDIVDEIVGVIHIGYGDGLHVKLKDNWEELVDIV